MSLTACSSLDAPADGGESVGESAAALTTRYEAETAAFVNAVSVANASYSGGAYLDLSGSAVVTWNITSSGGS